ncbi:hypothetical protein JTB14_006508 [Gonioctena quinquepunctata]|nr:hypothetical protein JTB14_006508 [Gonioctena quinquepunctata]
MPPQTTSFLHKVLLSIKQLQTQGDTHSELENSLCLAIQSRFLVKKKKYYTLVPPYAILHLIPEACVKAKLEEIQESYSSVECTDAVGNSRRKTKRIQFSQKDTSNSDLQKRVSKSNVDKKKSSGKNNKRKRRSNSRIRSRSRSPKKTKFSKERTQCRCPSTPLCPESKTKSKSPERPSCSSDSDSLDN